MVSSLTETPNLLSTSQTRSLQRQRTTPSRARSGPSATMSFSAAFCFTESLLGRPGEVSLISPSMPRLLKACTQSRSVCRSIPPMRAATCRLMPSRIAASASKRRAWLASLLAAAACRNSLALIPSLSGIATMSSAPESVGSRVTASQPNILRNPPGLIQSDAVSESAFSRDGITMAGSLRDQVMLSLGYGCGLRAGEIVRLKAGDIDSAQMIIRIVQSKGRKDRHVMLPPELLLSLRQWWKARPTRFDAGVSPGERWLFPGRRQGQHLTYRQLSRLFHESAAAAGITKRVSLRSEEHTSELQSL